MDYSNIFDLYNKLIGDYQKSALKTGFPDMRNERKQYEFITHRVFGFYFVINYISSLNLKSTKPYQNALFTMMSKASADLLGIYYCLISGLEPQAGILLRSLYENYVYNSFIFKEETESRLELFFNYQFVQRGHHLKKQNESDENYIYKMGFSEKEIEDYNKAYDKYIKDYNSKSPFHWAYKIFKDRITRLNPNLLDLCKDLGVEYVKDYNSLYPTSSSQSHPSSILGDYFTIDDGTRMINSPIYKDTIVNTAAVSVDYCGRILVNFIKYFNVKDFENLTKYIEAYITITHDEGLAFLKNKGQI